MTFGRVKVSAGGGNRNWKKRKTKCKNDVNKTQNDVNKTLNSVKKSQCRDSRMMRDPLLREKRPLVRTEIGENEIFVTRKHPLVVYCNRVVKVLLERTANDINEDDLRKPTMMTTMNGDDDDEFDGHGDCGDGDGDQQKPTSSHETSPPSSSNVAVASNETPHDKNGNDDKNKNEDDNDAVESCDDDSDDVCDWDESREVVLVGAGAAMKSALCVLQDVVGVFERHNLRIRTETQTIAAVDDVWDAEKRDVSFVVLFVNCCIGFFKL